MHEPEDSDDRTEDDRTDDSDAGLGAKLLQNVVEWLESQDTNVEYSTDVRTGLDDVANSVHGDSSVSDRRTRRPSTTDRPRTKRQYSSDHLTTTRRDGDELVVSMDLPGVNPDDVVVGLSEGDLVVTVEDRPIERIPLELPEVEAKSARYKNGILEVRLRSAGGFEQ